MNKRVGEVIRALRKSHGMEQAELAEAIGKSRAAIGNYETGFREPDFETLEAIADVFNIPLAAFFGDPIESHRRAVQGLMPIENLDRHRIPLIGSVAGGEPILADEDYEIYLDGPLNAEYALRLHGHSMEPTYMDGDVIYIHQTPNVNDGEIAVVLLDDSATLKRVYHMKNGLQLLSDNPKYSPMIKTFDECDTIRILGRPIGYTRMYE